MVPQYLVSGKDSFHIADTCLLCSHIVEVTQELFEILTNKDNGTIQEVMALMP